MVVTASNAGGSAPAFHRHACESLQDSKGRNDDASTELPVALDSQPWTMTRMSRRKRRPVGLTRVSAVEGGVSHQGPVRLIEFEQAPGAPESHGAMTTLAQASTWAPLLAIVLAFLSLVVAVLTLIVSYLIFKQGNHPDARPVQPRRSKRRRRRRR